MRYLSLFSGIEACTVAWEGLGWEPAAFAEFDDFPKAVLHFHYPDVPDLGDVAKITEDQIKALGPIDIVVGGSPCQDLSVAGKRAGLIDESGNVTRSGLFGEQMRIFEIARKNNGCRFMLWENVPGAFSSNKGNDFGFILGSMVKRDVPVPEDGWRTGGVCVSESGDRIVEWRVLDAQYFGVAQRRRRVFALLDTGAWWSRQPILFEQEGVCGDIAACGDEGEGVAGGAGNCFTPSSFGGYQTGVGTLRANGGDLGGGRETLIFENHANDSRVTRCEDGIVPTLSSRMGTGGGNVPLVMSSGQANAEIAVGRCPTLSCLHQAPIVIGGKGILCSEEKTFTLSTVDNMRVCMNEIVFQLSGDRDNPSVSVSDKAYCLPANPMSDRGQSVMMQEVWSVDSISSNSMKSSNPHSGFHISKVIKTLDTSVPDPSKNQGGHIIMEKKAMAFAQNTRDEVRYQNGDGQIVGALSAQPGMKQTTYIKTNTVVRRLTPVECERLQGFPDNYTNIPWGKKDTAPDSRRYKALGNSMAVPVMRWIAERIDWAMASQIAKDMHRPFYTEPDLF